MVRPAIVLALLAASLCGSTTAGCNGAVIDLVPDAGGSDGGTADPAAAFTTATKSSAGAPLSAHLVDKVDILFDVDNSASMGDKQYYLQAAIPDLVNRLINPNCVDRAGATTGASTNGTCTNVGDRPEFTPVHDLHLGLVTSSLGPRGGDACPPNAMAVPFSNVPAHMDDQAHLLDRSLAYAADGTSVAEGIVADAPAGDPYLYWFPIAANVGKIQGPGNPITNGLTLIQDFTDMVGGAGVFGCGIESQLESWYRFLVQPDPYASISINGNLGNATGVWNGVDQTLLQQRHDFLRPDSVVLIVDLSDENDSEIDVRSIYGVGVNWLAGAFQPPNGTGACASNPASPACQSCATGSNLTDPQCKQKASYTAINDWGYDVNLRHVHMKAKYGVDPQFPIERYVTGLTSTTVPDRNGEYPSGASSYVGTPDCQNPLFAGSLPDGSSTTVSALCHAPPGARTKDLVFFAHIGGVPSQLLHFDPSSMARSALSAADWVKILGKDPESYDYSGIDPHMIESTGPRAGLAPPGSASNADPVDGHEWITSSGSGHILQVDLQYACTFPLADSKGNATPRDCTLAQNQYACDCPHTSGSVTTEELPPICDTTTQTTQLAAKAYPTVRELLLAEKLGKQGIVSSICPIDVVDNATQDDPLFGYRPAVALIANGLKGAFGAPCLPAPLPVDPTAQEAPCFILLQIPGGVNGTSGSCLNPTCPPSFGLLPPDPSALTKFCGSLEDQYNSQVSANNGSHAGLTDPANVPVCQLKQLVPTVNEADFQGGTCAASTEKGWCYVTGAAAGLCSQSAIFSPNAIPAGAMAKLLCTQ